MFVTLRTVEIENGATGNACLNQSKRRSNKILDRQCIYSSVKVVCLVVVSVVAVLRVCEINAALTDY